MMARRLMGVDDMRLIALDTFTDVDTTLLTAHTMDLGGFSWAFGASTMQILSDHALPTTASVRSVATFDSGVSNGKINIVATFTENATAPIAGIVIRYTDIDNYIFLRLGLGGNSLRIYERVAGVETLKAFGGLNFSLGDPQNLSLEFSGTSIIARRTQIAPISYTSSFNLSATTCGILATPQTVVLAPKIDSFALFV